MPLPTAMKYRAKPFADVAVDRFAKGVGAALLIVAIKFAGFSWWQLSYAEHRGRGALDRDGAPRAARISAELPAQPGNSRHGGQGTPVDRRGSVDHRNAACRSCRSRMPARVVYAIDMLESLDKRSLVTPLLLYHESPDVRRRALRAIGAVRRDIALGWLPQIRRMLGDPDSGVRAAAIVAIGKINNEDAATLSRPLLNGSGSADPRDGRRGACGEPARLPTWMLAEATLVDLAADDTASLRASGRRRCGSRNPPHRATPIPPAADSAAIRRGARGRARGDARACRRPAPPTSSSCRRWWRCCATGNSRHARARCSSATASRSSTCWRTSFAIRRRTSGCGATCRPRSRNSLARSRSTCWWPRSKSRMGSSDSRLSPRSNGFAAPISRCRSREKRSRRRRCRKGRTTSTTCRSTATCSQERRSRAANCCPGRSMQKMERTTDRIYRLLALIYPWRDIGAARWTLGHGEARSRASASEYLDNILTGQLRKRIMPVLEDLPSGRTGEAAATFCSKHGRAIWKKRCCG